jgi:hypothetical protein
MDEIILDCGVFFDIYDIEEELSSAEFLRIVRLLPAYDGALKTSLEVWAKKHEAELTDMQEAVQTAASAPVALSADALKNNPKLGPAPAAGQLAPIFDIREL